MHDPSMKGTSTNIKPRDSEYHHVKHQTDLMAPDWHITAYVR